MSCILYQSVPHKTTIFGGLWPGKNISIQGVVNPQASRSVVSLILLLCIIRVYLFSFPVWAKTVLLRIVKTWLKESQIWAKPTISWTILLDPQSKHLKYSVLGKSTTYRSKCQILDQEHLSTKDLQNISQIYLVFVSPGLRLTCVTKMGLPFIIILAFMKTWLCVIPKQWSNGAQRSALEKCHFTTDKTFTYVLQIKREFYSFLPSLQDTYVHVYVSDANCFT